MTTPGQIPESGPEYAFRETPVQVASSSPFTELACAPTQWLWQNRIPRGKITLLIGEAGSGKSFLTLDLAARLSRGLPLPGDTVAPAPSQRSIVKPDHPTGPLATLILSDDDTTTTTAPRLAALGADMAHIHCLSGMRTLIPWDHAREKQSPRDEPPVDDPVAQLRNVFLDIPNLALVIIDPITAFLGTTDRKLGASRTILSDLAQLASLFDIAIVLTTGLSKPIPEGQEHLALHHAIGARTYVNLARAVHLITEAPPSLDVESSPLPPSLDVESCTLNVGRSPVPSLDPSTPGPLDPSPIDNRKSQIDNPSALSAFSLQNSALLVPLKITDAPRPPALSFQLADSKLLWDTAPVVLPSPHQPFHEAVHWLQETLADGPRRATAMQKEAKEAEISRRLLKRARDALHVECTKTGFASLWFWRLPGDTRQPPNGDDARDVCLAKMDADLAHIWHSQPPLPPDYDECLEKYKNGWHPPIKMPNRQTT